MTRLETFLTLAKKSKFSCDICTNDNREKCIIVTHKAVNMRLCMSCARAFRGMRRGKGQTEL